MAQFIFATESYPFTTDVTKLFDPKDDDAILLTKDVNQAMTTDQLRRFRRVVTVKGFDYATLHRVLTHDIRVAAGARIVSHDDFVYPLIARLNEELRLEGFSRQSIAPFVDKNVMKQRLVRAGLRTPRYTMFEGDEFAADPCGYTEKIAEALKFPVFAKPIDGAGAVHTSLLRDKRALVRWCEAHLTAANYELDEFIGDSDLYHCDSIIQRGRVTFTQVCKYTHPCADFSDGKVVGSYTLNEGDPIAIRLQRFADQVIAAFGTHHRVPDGVTHMEVFHTASDELVFLEVQLRPPGANCRAAYHQRLSVNLEEIHYRLQMGREVILPSPAGPFAAWLFFPTTDGVVDTVVPLPGLRSEIIAQDYFVGPGRATTHPDSILDAVSRGYVALSLVLRSANLMDLEADIEALKRYRPYEIRSLPDSRGIAQRGFGNSELGKQALEVNW